jgi:nicotinate-nucleotide pyrophosphorylase (carboxylating)
MADGFTWGDLVRRALDEDIGRGDVTTDATVAPEAQGCARLVAKAPLVVAGTGITEEIFRVMDFRTQVTWQVQDGEAVEAGARLAQICGSIRAILKAERVALNFFQHLSGIATLTRAYVQAAAGTGVRILDTRKTTPGLRILEKQAVRLGGGYNHRLGLDDGVLIKENHITAAGGIAQAIASCRSLIHHLLKIEVEVKNLAELEEALAAGADAILLDNMTLSQVRAAVALVGKRVPLEVSGGVSLANVGALAGTGVDFISVGALTHSAPAADISLLLQSEPG